MCTQTKQTNEQVMQGVPLDKIGGACVGCVCCSVLKRGAVSLRVLQGVPLDKREVCVLQFICSVSAGIHLDKIGGACVAVFSQYGSG